MGLVCTHPAVVIYYLSMSDVKQAEYPQWEYRIEKSSSFYGPDIEEFLEETGKEGWELVSVATILPGMIASHACIYYFKRSKQAYQPLRK